MLEGAMFLPEEVMIISFLRSTTLRKPSSSISPMSPVWIQPSPSISVGARLGVLVVAAGVHRVRGSRISPSSAIAISMPGCARPTVPSRKAAGTAGGDRAGGLGHPVDVVDRQAEPGEEAGGLDRHRGGRAAGPGDAVEAEHRLHRAEHGGVDRVELRLQLGAGLLARLQRLDVLQPDGHRVGDGLLLGLVGLHREQAADAGLDLLPDAGYAEEPRRAHLAERADSWAGSPIRCTWRTVDLRDVDAEHALGDVGVGEVGDTDVVALEPGRAVAALDLEEHVVVGDHHALGVPGRARGVEDRRRVVGVDAPASDGRPPRRAARAWTGPARPARPR